MPQKKSLQAILGTGSRVRKPRAPRSAAASASPSASPNRTDLQRGRAGENTGGRGAATTTADGDEDDNEQGYTEDEFEYLDSRLDDNGLVHALVTDLTLRDAAQAMRASRARMFSPVPARGLRSARIPALHARRATCPPLTTLAHLHALLASPSAAERELATLERGGVVRRVAVTRTAEVVEMLVLERDLEALLRGSEELGEHAKEEFGEWLRMHPGESAVAAGDLDGRTADALVREGFLTGKGYAGLAIVAGDGERSRLRLRPDERASLVSLDRVARAASGSVAAAGGAGVVYEAGGGGSRMRGDDGKDTIATDRTPHDLDLAVPGQGAFLRLATAAVEHIVSLVRTRSRFAEVPEQTLREWWDCATPAASKSSEAVRRRRKRAAGGGGGGGGQWSGIAGSVGIVMPDRTTKWRLLDGVRFEWALEEAVGMGVVEMFDAGSVGRGIRVV